MSDIVITVRPYHLSLGMVIARLEGEDPERVLSVGFDEPHSYRGYYQDVAFKIACNIKVGAMLAAAQSALGATYTGWKGGDYEMGHWTDCWLVANEGATGESLGALLLELLLAP